MISISDQVSDLKSIKQVAINFGKCKSSPCTDENFVFYAKCVVNVSPRHLSNHTRIQCSPESASGVGNVLQVIIGGQTSYTTDVLSYPDPVIYEGTLRFVSLSDIDYTPVYNAIPGKPLALNGSTTVGGVQVLEMFGRNLGAQAADLQVFHGPANNPQRYQCATHLSARQWNHTVIRCTLQAGTSHTNHFRVFLTHSGQYSKAGKDTFSYPAPEITADSLRLHPARGGTPYKNETSVDSVWAIVNGSTNVAPEVISLEGRFFGPEPADLVVTYTHPHSPFVYQADVIAANTSQTSILLRTVPGFGQGLFFTVTVGDQAATSTDMFSYPDNGLRVGANATSAARSSVAGSGLSIATAGASMSALIIGRDWSGRFSARGGDLWNVTVADSRDHRQNVTSVDHLDGTHAISFVPTVSGQYNARVRLIPLLGNARDTPFSVFVQPAADILAKGTVARDLEGSIRTAGVLVDFEIEARDVFGNRKLFAPDLFFTNVVGAQNKTLQIESAAGGRFFASTILTISGTYRYRLFYNGTESAISPFVSPIVANDATPGNALLLSGSQTMETTTDSFLQITLQLRDTFGNRRRVGGDVIATGIQAGPVSEGSSILVTDYLNGSYGILHRFTVAGSYSVALGLAGLESPLPFSPLSIDVVPGLPSPGISRLVGPTALVGTAGVLATFEVRVNDRFGNKISTGDVSLEMHMFLRQRSGALSEVEYLNTSFASGVYTAEYFRTLAGTYTFTVAINDKAMYSSPYTLSVLAGAVAASRCSAFQTYRTDLASATLGSEFGLQTGIYGGRANAPIKIIIVVRDTWGNNVNIAGVPFVVSVTGSSTVGAQQNLGGGYVLVDVTPTSTGTISLSVNYDSNAIMGSPFTSIKVNAPGAISAAQTVFPSHRLARSLLPLCVKPLAPHTVRFDYFHLAAERGGRWHQFWNCRGSNHLQDQCSRPV